MNRKWQLILVFMAAGACSDRAALALSGTSYTQNFDSIGNGLPTGWSVYTGATSSSLGTSASFSTAKTHWSETSGGFYNAASADGLLSYSSNTAQDGSSDRVLAVKQVGSGGYDPGAAIVLQIQNTAGYGNFSLSLKAQQLNSQNRSTTWLFQYRIGDSGDFITLSTFVDPGAWGYTSISFDSSDLAAWNDQSSDIWFRIVALSDSTGSNSRDMFAIDDFTLSYSVVPELDQLGLMSGAGLLAFCGFQVWRQRRCCEQRKS